MAVTTIGVGAEYARGSVRDQLTGGKRDHSGRIFQLLLLLSLGVSLGVLIVLFYDVFVDGVGVFSSRAEDFLSGGLRSTADGSGLFQASHRVSSDKTHFPPRGFIANGGLGASHIEDKRVAGRNLIQQL